MDKIKTRQEVKEKLEGIVKQINDIRDNLDMEWADDNADVYYDLQDIAFAIATHRLVKDCK